MSMEHKAFLFRFAEFERELRRIIEDALILNDSVKLKTFIVANHSELKDPCEGEPIETDWEQQIERPEPEYFGDIALTKYYDPKLDIGLGGQWSALDDRLIQSDRKILLGEHIGTSSHRFDPGKMGSWFQSEELVKQSHERLSHLLTCEERLRPIFSKARRMLESAVTSRTGLYITF